MLYFSDSEAESRVHQCNTFSLEIQSGNVDANLTI